VPTSPESSKESGWRPSASLATLRLRAQLLEQTRVFFTRRGLLEVETPALSTAAATDLHLESLRVGLPWGEELGWLHTSPEFPMKRLLAAGAGDIWQLARVFRGAERGRRHNPEFTMLEWYRVGWTLAALMEEVEAYLEMLAEGLHPLGHGQQMTYRDAFLEHADLDPFSAAPAAIASRLEQQGIAVPPGLASDPAACLDLALATLVEPRLDPRRPTFIYDFPASHAALARIRPGDPPVAERFELFLGGMEIANGFHELTDASEQAARFEADLAARRARGLTEPPVDRRLLEAMMHGLPDCSGVALGFDRLVMVLAGAAHIEEVLAFGGHC
jgi:elongation factor P--(R)-beta-lysine ligase